MHAVMFGASRGCGYFACLNLLAAGWTVTLLLRKPETIETDPKFAEYLESGSCKFVKGDGMVVDDVRKCFPEGKQVDLVLSSVGMAPPDINSVGQVVDIFRHGFVLPIPDITSVCGMSILTAMQELKQPKVPRLVIVSTMGLGKRHDEMPWFLRWFYGYLESPHIDKEGLEYVVRRSSATFTTPSAIPHILKPEAVSAIRADWIPETIIVQPALLMDGEATNKFRSGEKVPNAWTIRRADVGGFLATECAEGDKWVGKEVILAY